MAQADPRRNGRWTAVYFDEEGRRRSAGTYDTADEALAVAEEQEEFVQRRMRDLALHSVLSPAERAQLTVEQYWKPWLRSHPVEPSTKKTYRALMMAHILPAFGEVTVRELSREQIREYLTEMKDNGAGVSSQRGVRAVLSAMMQTAWDDGYRKDNPVRGVKVEKKTRKKITVMTHEEFAKVYKCLPTEGAQYFADTIVSTGCRIDEATVLTVSDWDPKARRFSFDKALQDAGSEFYTEGRWHIGETKTHEQRDVGVGRALAANVDAWIAEHNLSGDDLLFPAALVMPESKRARKERAPAPEGRVQASNGLWYDHGTMGGYSTARCRCDACRAWASEYSAERRRARAAAAGREVKAQAPSEETPFLTDDRWRVIWTKACEAADIGWSPTAYQLRHTCASWLIDAGESVQKVRERLGHASLDTTSLYVHHVSDDQSSADIFDDLRAW